MARWLIALVWLIWSAVWVAMAPGAKSVAQSESRASRLTHVVPLVVAVALLAAPRVPVFPLRFVPPGPWPGWIGAALTAAGIAFAIWARVTLAGNWSGSVTLKDAHELVVEGPYRWVRHPIYTGLLLALLGWALAVGEWRGLLAVAIAAMAFWRKLKREEALMRAEFGAAYADYAQRVPALVPFLR